MLNFDFVSDEKFRLSLEKDYQELLLCLKYSAWKPAHLLAGSIIEAVLVDYLVATGHKYDGPLHMTLEEALSACRREEMLSERTEQVAYIVQSYRNLIHPDKNVRLGETIDENSARIAQALVEMITKEVAEAKKKKYGFTAEQIVNKVAKDGSTNTVLSYLLSNTKELEKKRLLVEVLPQKYIEYLEKVEYGVSSILGALTKAFYIVFQAVSDGTRKEVAQHFVQMIRESSPHHLYVRQHQFFKGHFLAYLNEDDAKFVKKHLFSCLEEQVSKSMLRTLEGVGEFIQKDDVHEFISPIVLSAFKGSRHSTASLEDVGEFLSEEYGKMPEDAKEYIQSFLQEERWSFRNDNDKERLTYLRNLIMVPKIWTSRWAKS